MRSHAWRGRTTVAIAAAMLLATGGCGSFQFPPTSSDPGARLLTASACDRSPAPEDASTLIVLDWDGGVSPLVAGRDLSAFDVGLLNIAGPVPQVADLDSTFKQAVLARVQENLCDLDPMDVAVAIGDGDTAVDATVVLITGDLPPDGSKHIGQSDYDACNANPDDAALIWGGAIATRVGSATYDQWINAIANTTTHEIGHTLGFFHPTADTFGRPLPIPADEIMQANVTVSSLLSPQRFIVEQDTCPSNPAASYRLIDSSALQAQ